MKNFILLSASFLIISCSNELSSSQGEDFTNQVNQVSNQTANDSSVLQFFDRPAKPIEWALDVLPSGSVKPDGWIAKMMAHDIEDGIVAKLPDLFPSIQKDDIYDKDRRGGLDDVPDMGDLVLVGDEWETSIMWWNAETIGNWWDGYVRHAYLVDDEEAIDNSQKIVSQLLKSQDESGYLGIYRPNLRYKHEGSNGELWAQTTAFRMLLAYYEFTGDEEVLSAVERAMKLTMLKYGPDGSNPFDVKNEFGGVTHGLMLTDVCETLYRITGKQAYQHYATFLYRAYSTYGINRAFNDLRYSYLLDEKKQFSSHAVHTYEHFRSLLQAYYATGFPELKTATATAFDKLANCMLPSGAGHGNEWIAELPANATKTSTEFCALLELRNSFTSALFKSGDLKFAENAEKITFNAMMGFRDEAGYAITYGKADNAYQIDGKHHHSDGKTTDDPRFKYSPVHSEPAVCCVPNYGRNMSYYLDQMWASKNEQLFALMYGPSVLNTKINGKSIRISQETNYPFSGDISLKINNQAILKLTINLRIPSWAKSLSINGEKIAINPQNDFFKYIINKEYEEIIISFGREVELLDFNNEVYFQHGPLVYALPIPHQEKIIKTYPDSKFKDYYAIAVDDSWSKLSVIKSSEVTYSQFENKPDSWPWHNENTYLTVKLFDARSGELVPKNLLPIGSTTLRRLTFPLKEQ